MCDFCSTTPITGALFGSTPMVGACSLRSHWMYSSLVSKTRGATGCQMPWSGMTVGGSTTSPVSRSDSKTYVLARLSSSASMFSGEPPSQYCSDIMKERASLALSPGRNLSTLGSVRTSFSMPSWNEVPLGLFFFMKSSITFLDWPIDAIVKEPILLRRITAGIDGKTQTASIVSRYGSTASTTLSASSCTKMSEPMKMLASATSFLNCSKLAGSRSSSRM
mmetsp:Transcript_36665/g.109031  ORF Transcript_36665/g.109031 Transcript_36665/m.109031 type:complete len:221 (-) Transcript_36665:485-1147(-)